jgi:transketolase
MTQSRIIIDDTIQLAKQVRLDVIDMSFRSQVGHVPSALSMVDYLSVAFSRFLCPPTRLILGKPYGAQTYYALFARLGWMPFEDGRYGSEELQWTYCIGYEHPLVHFVDDTMGNALSVACGVALGFNGRVFFNTGDAAFQAGSVWEALIFAGARMLGNLLVTVDNNHMQVLGQTPDILDVEPFDKRLGALGWRVFVVDGHNHKELIHTFEVAFKWDQRPTVVVCNTVKGYGVKFMENNPDWHYRLLTKDLLEEAKRGLS